MSLDAEHVENAQLANAIRCLAIDGVEAAKSGHPGMPMGAADIATALFARHLKFDAAHPRWPDRDRFILSAGHGSMLLYALLHLTGAPGMSIEEIRNFRQLGSLTPGHPEYGHTPGVEMTTGPLGQGLASAVGFALAERRLAAEFGEDLVDHHTYVLAGDGCLMEGISQEAIALAGHLKLSRLIVLWDDNRITIDGPVSLSCSVDQIARFEAAGWASERVDGHDQDAVSDAIARAKKSDKPTLIACRTTIGYGSPNRAGSSKAHGEPLGAQEAAAAKAQLGWPATAPFEIPAKILKAWRDFGARGAQARQDWERRLAASGVQGVELSRRLRGELKPEALAALKNLAQKFATEKPAIASRKASEAAIEAITPYAPELLMGSADLTGSNNTKAKAMQPIAPGAYRGDYIYYGVREHAMAAIMNGLSLHGGFIPGGGTFLAFSDYCRPSIRLAALMGLHVVYVFTHDSIGLGEDGPTHQPVEHLAALRAIPNLAVLRPADAIETAQAWAFALQRREGPSALILSRQNLPTFPRAGGDVADGAYVVAGGDDAQASLFASGSELAVALAARELLAQDKILARVVSVPKFEAFFARPKAEREKILGAVPRAGVEAGIRQGWDALIGAEGIFVGMTGFGASAPAPALFKHFEITPEILAQRVKDALYTHTPEESGV